MVLGRALAPGCLIEDALPEHAVYWAKDQVFPMIEPQQGASASGLRVSGLTDADLARLEFYEAGFQFDLRPVVLESGATAEVFFARNAPWQPGAPWDLAAWSATHGPLTLGAAAEVMSYYGTKSGEDVADMFQMIRNRAWARLLAADSPAPNLRAPLAAENLEIIDKTRCYVDFFALDEVNLKFPRFEGGLSRPVKRAIFIGADAVIVLPYDAQRDRVLVVEQFRAGPYLRGNPHPWMLEPVAGIIDAGEAPEETAMRETLEETGVALNALVPVAGYYPSPGASTEYHHAYIGLADLADGVGGVAGLESESENIRSHVLSFEAFMALLDSGEVETGPLLLCGHWLARNRDRLRAGA